jgi:hypothetical protein
MVQAEHDSAALQRVLAPSPGRFDLTEPDQGVGQGGCGPQGSGVVVAEHPAAAAQGVLAQGAGRLHLTY